MKKTQEIIGLPIISISDGMEVGKVKSIIINADKGAIDYIVVESGIQILNARVIPTDNILGVGEYAMTIENNGAVNEISKIPAAIDLLQKNIQVLGTKVLTKKGRLIGEIGDIFVDDDDSFRITGLEYIADITQKRIRIIPRECVITFGKNLVVVKDDVENALLERPTQLGSGDKTTEAEKKNIADFSDNSQYSSFSFQGNITGPDEVTTKADTLIANKGETYYREIEKPDNGESFKEQNGIFNKNEQGADAYKKPVDSEVPFNEGIFPGSEYADSVLVQDNSASTAESSAASLFEQRQRQYLNGRRATKTIADNSGNVIVSEGAVISDDVIDDAKSKGKLIELVMNNKA